MGIPQKNSGLKIFLAPLRVICRGALLLLLTPKT